MQAFNPFSRPEGFDLDEAAAAAFADRKKNAAQASGMVTSGGWGAFGSGGGSFVSAGGDLSATPGNTGFTNFHAAPVDLPPPPAGPGLGKLKKQLEVARNKEAIDAAMKEYDELEASTKAYGFQAAENAGNVYSARLMQAGINPLASGVVTAQAKLPVYRQVAEIGTEREKTRLDATSRADALAAQIAGQIAQLQLGYANTLAQYNSNMAGYEIDMNKFNAGQDLSATELSWRMQQAANAASGGSGGGSTSVGAGGPLGFGPAGSGTDVNALTAMFPNYVGNSGPISSRSPNQIGTYAPNSGGPEMRTSRNSYIAGYGGPRTSMGTDFEFSRPYDWRPSKRPTGMAPLMSDYRNVA